MTNDSKAIYVISLEFYKTKYPVIIKRSRNVLAKRMLPILERLESEDRSIKFGPEDIKSEENKTKLLKYLSAIVQILTGMFNHPSDSNFWQSDFAEFLTKISMDCSYLPKNYLYDFEFKRLKFSSTGSTIGMAGDIVEMMIGNFVFVRVLFKEFLFAPQKALDEIPGNAMHLTSETIDKLQQFACYFYYIYLMDIIDSIPESSNPASGVKLKDRIPSVVPEQFVYCTLLITANLIA